MVGRAVSQAGLTPCLVLAASDDETAAEVALAAGASDFLAMDALTATKFERAVQFCLQRRRQLDAVVAREMYLASARERDRQRLANALHDGPLQDLIGARFLLGALAAEGSTGEIQDSLQSVIQTVRALCSDLKPPALGPFGLEKAIRAHIQTFQARSPQLSVTLELDGDNQRLPEWARYALFRVFQAAIANVAKHAQASQIWVRLLLEDEQLRLTVADDGQGFEVPDSWLDFARTARFGLLMMQERVDALHGRMVVQSTPGGGTRVMAFVPMDQPPVPLPAYLIPAVSDRNG
jgi:signal transduction histidine kinase